MGAAGKGPTLLLVKDKQGQLFGGYASEPWLKNGKYYGEVHYLPTTCYCHLCVFNLFVAAFTSVALKEQWPGLGKAAETESSLDHWQQHVRTDGQKGISVPHYNCGDAMQATSLHFCSSCCPR